jgi:hypothetical protein
MALSGVDTENNSGSLDVVIDSPDRKSKIDGKVMELYRSPRIWRRDPDFVLVANNQPQLSPDIYTRVIGLNFKDIEKVKPGYFDSTTPLEPSEITFGDQIFKRNQAVLFKHNGQHYIGRAFAATIDETPEPLLLLDTGIPEFYEVCALTFDEYMFWNKPQSFDDFIKYQLENNPNGIQTNDPSKLISLEKVIDIWDFNIRNPRVKQYQLDTRNPFYSEYHTSSPTLAEALTRMYNNYWANK